MLKDHAMIEREGFKVPLIGISPSEVLEECDLCHDKFPMSEVEFDSNSGQMLCKKCRKL